MRLAVGTRLGKYEILRFIAEGGMGELYVARASGIEGFEKTVALKRILSRYASRDEHVRMFLDEAKLAATLHHPNIVQVFDMGNEAGSLFFAMEYVHGTDLRAMLEKARENGRPIPWAVAIEIAIEIAAALHHAHQAGLVHRDVSPSNVLLAYDGIVKLTDFGIAKAVEKPGETRPGMLKGKVSYMSPEQCRDEELDRRSDVFSLGSLLFELTTLEQPFAATSEFATMEQIVRRDAESPATKRAEYPPELAAIVLRALSRDREQRYASAQDLQRELIAFARGHGIDNSPLVLESYLRELFGDEVDAWRRAFVESTQAALPTAATVAERTAPRRARRWALPAAALAAIVLVRAAWTPYAVVPARDAACVVEISAGGDHVCLRQHGGAVACWGGNATGQLASEDHLDRSTPTPAGVTAVEVASGVGFTCARLADATVSCWGDDEAGQLGDGQLEGHATPSHVKGLIGVTRISAGSAHACAVAAGRVWCWGDNEAGQLGDKPHDVARAPVEIALSAVAVDVAAGANHTCALDRDGKVWCWGDGEAGQLGTGTFQGRPSPAVVTGLPAIAAISAGSAFTCAAGRDGSAWCWGANDEKQLGVGGETSSTPVRVSVSDVREIHAGAAFACIRRDDRSVWCWGDNRYGQLGNPGATAEPIAIRGLPAGDIVEVTTGATHACARGHIGRVWCWGDARDGRLGDRGEIFHVAPVTSQLRSATTVALGTSHSCALVGTAVSCWGEGAMGQLGDGRFIARSTPAVVPGVEAVQVAATDHTCARSTDGSVWCWGNNSTGQVDGVPAVYRGTPARVASIPSSVEIAVGDDFTCSRDRSGAVWCWGDNSAGQLGNMTTSPKPIKVPLPMPAAAVSAGSAHACAILTGGDVWCWGQNEGGELGDGTFLGRGPVHVALASPVVELVVAGLHACARAADNAVSCWGSDERGELGDGGGYDEGRAVRVVALPKDIAQLAAGRAHTCARSSDGSVRCWGANTFGQLGDRTTTDRDTPVVTQIAGAKTLAANGAHSCAIVADGSLRCWGSNGRGQLGDGTPLSSAVPREVVTSCRL